ncbi:MAG TPA: spore germination protein [Ruminiclostridium sp.]|nr:spore germination protein [Ruminiclostridium sp.]
MSQKKSFIGKFFSFITYKEERPKKQFVIPEIDNEDTKQEEDNQDKKNSGAKESSPKNRGIKKPVPVKDSGKENKPDYEKADDETISTKIEENIKYIKHKFNAPDNKDIIIRELTVAKKYKAFVTYIDGMVDRTTINDFILKALMVNDDKFEEDADEECQLEFILSNVLQTNQAKKVEKPEEFLYEILQGNTLLYVDGCDYYITNETKGYDKRSVEKPLVEGVVLGSQEAFNETLRTNVTLVRKLIKNNNLTTEFIKVGNVNKQLCAVLSIKGITNPAIVHEVKRRIKSIKSDMILGDGILEQYIEDSPFSLVPTILTTERPDRTAAHILEGRVAILVEGAPFAKIVPVTLPALMHSPEDAYMRWPYGTLIRAIRFIAAFIATLLPGLYVAITNFHQEMIPTELLIAIAKAKENVPFPTIVEVVLMELSFELIREAGIRIPGIIGNTLGIIGALILGQAAVQANIVSPVLIIVVSVTGLGNFAIPNYSLALAARVTRFCFIILAALLGFYGINIGIALLAILLTNIKSFGVPFFSPIAPKTKESSDLFFRKPAWQQMYRPDYVNSLRQKRQTKISRQWTEEEPEYSYERDDDDD